MSKFDSPKSNGDNGDAGQAFDLIELSPEECETAWQLFAKKHIPPSRLLRLAAGMELRDIGEREHLKWCSACRNAYQRYSPLDRNVAGTADAADNKGEVVASTQQKEALSAARPWRDRVSQLQLFPCGHEEPNSVPELLRKHLQLSGAVVFGGNEVAFESWQFGRLVSGELDPSIAAQLVDMTVDAAEANLITWNASKNLLLVCFGQAMHKCGTRIAIRLAERGFLSPHVVLAHDYYSPTVVCSKNEFVDADVIVLVDVVHSGTTLNGLLALSVSRGARRVRGLALIDQSEGRPLCAEWHSLWQEPKEHRIPLDSFIQRASDDEIKQLRRFEPNNELALGSVPRIPSTPQSVTSNRLSVDNELTKHIHNTGALKRDHAIGQKRYPYVVNVLDLINKSAASRSFILAHANNVLSDLKEKEVALAFHAGRKQRAGRLASLLGSRFKWPVVPIGSTGPEFRVADSQLKQLASYDAVVVVDAALRTGDSLTALIGALEDKLLLKHAQFVSLCVLNGLSAVEKNVLASSLGVEIRTLFDFPLPPPTEEVRHWANLQKAIIRSRMASSGDFAQIAHVLSGYCAPSKFVPPLLDSSIGKTRKIIAHVVQTAQAAMTAPERIDAACVGTAPQFIRHLPVNEVVHDRSVQDLLVGVMFNSVQPSLKESAAFALAAARNYEWMTLDWLKLNRPFLASKGHAWKSIVMIECEMRLSGRQRELTHFRDATLKFKEEEEARIERNCPNPAQLLLPNISRDRSAATGTKSKENCSSDERLIERLDTFVVAAN